MSFTDKALTNNEKHQVSNIFAALDSNHDNKLDRRSEWARFKYHLDSLKFGHLPMPESLVVRLSIDAADTDKDAYLTRQDPEP